MAKRPRIGVTCSDRGGRLMWQFNRLALWRAGVRAVRLSPGGRTSAVGLDGLILGGGDDIEAALYEGDAVAQVRVDPERDALERELVGVAWARELPLLGICRGAQMINVARGGTLHGEVRAAYPEARHRKLVLRRKRVDIRADSRLGTLLGVGHCRVNALHHQAVDRAGAGLRIVAEDRHGMVQALEASDGRFVLGVQWHPEFLIVAPEQRRLFRGLVDAARSRSYCSAQISS